VETLERLSQERLTRTEASLKLAGAVKCNSCGYWVDNFYISKGSCDKCNDKKEVIK